MGWQGQVQICRQTSGLRSFWPCRQGLEALSLIWAHSPARGQLPSFCPASEKAATAGSKAGSLSPGAQAKSSVRSGAEIAKVSQGCGAWTCAGRLGGIWAAGHQAEQEDGLTPVLPHPNATAGSQEAQGGTPTGGTQAIPSHRVKTRP